MVLFLSLALSLVAIACVVLSCFGLVFLLPGAAIALGFLLLCTIVEDSLRGVRLHMAALRDFLEERDTYKEWREYKKEHPHRHEESPPVPSP
ncbi:MAG: DUF4190 domain-containing protein [Planctomycetes bacterium]|nr:DUF4190 domain-containing protein [Planctomycetota bacterium]